MGVGQLLAQIPPITDNPVPPWVQEGSPTVLCMFAIWWLGKQNTKISQDAAQEKRELKDSFLLEKEELKEAYEKRLEEFKDELKEVRGFLLSAFKGINVTQTTKRAQTKLQERDNG